MQAPFWLDCESIDALPSVEEIRRLATSEKNFMMRFPIEADGANAQATKREVIALLTRELPGFGVFEIGGEPGISQYFAVKQVISDAEVMSHAKEFAAAAAQFRALANVLMAQLATHLNRPLA